MAPILSWYMLKLQLMPKWQAVKLTFFAPWVTIVQVGGGGLA